MQVNTLNRIISLFLKGGLLLVAVSFFFVDDIRRFSCRHGLDQEWSAASGVLLAVGLLSVTALAGTVLDALGNVTIRPFIRMIGDKKSRTYFFLCCREFDEQERWGVIFAAELRKSEKYALPLGIESLLKPFSAGLFFRTAQKDHIEWLVQHHSIYNLSADFVPVLLGCSVFSGQFGWWWPFILVGAAYLLTTFALDNYLYSYQLTFRNAYLALRDESMPTGLAQEKGSPNLQVE